MARSQKRNDGIWVSSPKRIAAWLAGVVEGMGTHHGVSRCVPSWSQRATVGICPAARARSKTCTPSPSSCTITNPLAAPVVRRRRRRLTYPRTYSASLELTSHWAPEITTASIARIVAA